MKILCKIIREGGTKVEFGKKVYHFKPEAPDGELHVCEVDDQGHIDRLLSITEAYVEFSRKDDAEPEPVAPAAAAPSPVHEWSNKKVMAYAKEVLRIVPEDKKAIAELAEAHGLKLDARKGAAPMLRTLVAHIGVQDDEKDDIED